MLHVGLNYHKVTFLVFFKYTVFFSEYRNERKVLKILRNCLFQPLKVLRRCSNTLINSLCESLFNSENDGEGMENSSKLRNLNSYPLLFDSLVYSGNTPSIFSLDSFFVSLDSKGRSLYLGLVFSVRIKRYKKKRV